MNEREWSRTAQIAGLVWVCAVGAIVTVSVRASTEWRTAYYDELMGGPVNCYHLDMKEFFKGWRHKVGVVTLLMALVLMGGWVRSLFQHDLLWIETGERSYLLVSTDGCFRGTTARFHFESVLGWIGQKKERPTEVVRYTTINGSVTMSEADIPYWYFVLPLTLLSACLIVWKPRTRA